MPSKSKAQQRFFGMVDAYKKGEMKNASSKIKKAAKGMSMGDVKDFAETKHKGLPEKVNEQTIIRLTESDLHRIVKESVNKILSEGKNDEIIKNVVDTVMNDEKLSEEALSCFHPRLLMFPGGTQNQQLKWRKEEFISRCPQIFKQIMSIPLRMKIAEAVYMELRRKYNF